MMSFELVLNYFPIYISEFKNVVSFLSKVVDKIIPTVRVKTFPNQKSWVDRHIHMAVNARTAAYVGRVLKLVT